jgi:antitoxin VapB
MALNIKNPEVERLAAEVAELTGESKTEAIRRALAARRELLAHQVARPRKGASFLRYLEEDVWPAAPEGALDRPRSRREREEILGFGPEGV